MGIRLREGKREDHFIKQTPKEKKKKGVDGPHRLEPKGVLLEFKKREG